MRDACAVPVRFEEVVAAIAETAFLSSPYPVSLSLENHCSLRQQGRMHAYMRKYFGGVPCPRAAMCEASSRPIRSRT
jgi:hypothetical protein